MKWKIRFYRVTSPYERDLSSEGSSWCYNMQGYIWGNQELPSLEKSRSWGIVTGWEFFVLPVAPVGSKNPFVSSYSKFKLIHDFPRGFSGNAQRCNKIWISRKGLSVKYRKLDPSSSLFCFLFDFLFDFFVLNLTSSYCSSSFSFSKWGKRSFIWKKKKTEDKAKQNRHHLTRMIVNARWLAPFCLL